MDGQPTAKSLKWFPTPGILTDPGEKSHFFSDLPDEIETLCQVIQNNLIHILWAERYGRELSETEKETVNIRFVDKK